MSRLSGKWSKRLGKIIVTKENFEKRKGEKGGVHRLDSGNVEQDSEVLVSFLKFCFWCPTRFPYQMMFDTTSTTSGVGTTYPSGAH